MQNEFLPLFYTFHFYLFGLIALASALAFVTRKSPVAAALWLVMTMFALAALYVMLDAQFIGMMQVLVYAGAIAVLPKDRLAVSTRLGDIYLVDGAFSNPPKNVKFTRFATGLHEVAQVEVVHEQGERLRPERVGAVFDVIRLVRGLVVRPPRRRLPVIGRDVVRDAIQPGQERRPAVLVSLDSRKRPDEDVGG